MRVGHKIGFKICTIGSHSVGKTAIIHRYANGIFSASPLPTIETVITPRSVMVDGKSIKLNVWDTAGQERFKSTVPIYLRDVHCIILVFDLTVAETWEQTKDWIETQLGNFEIKPLIVICANKSDLDPVVSEDEISAYAKQNDFQYFLTSAATGKGIKDLFMYISRTLMVKFPQEIGESQSTLVDTSNQKGKCGC